MVSVLAGSSSIKQNIKDMVEKVLIRGQNKNSEEQTSSLFNKARLGFFSQLKQLHFTKTFD